MLNQSRAPNLTKVLAFFILLRQENSGHCQLFVDEMLQLVTVLKLITAVVSDFGDFVCGAPAV